MAKPHRIKELYAFAAIGSDGSEGIIAIQNQGAWTPFIGSDMERVKDLVSITEDMCKKHNKKYRILKFDNRSDVTEEIKNKFLK